MRRVYKNLCPATISASIIAANMWKNSLKNVESDNNKILYETLLDFFLQRKGTYFLNKPHRNLMNEEATACVGLQHQKKISHILLYSTQYCKVDMKSFEILASRMQVIFI